MSNIFEEISLSRLVAAAIRESKSFHLRPDQVPDNLKSIFDAIGMPGEKYRTTQFQFIVTDQVELINMQWSGGTKNDYVAVNLKTGESKPMIDPRPWPANQSAMPPVKIPPDWAIAKRKTYKGKNLGVEFYIHPSNAPAALPSPEKQGEGEGMPRDEEIVLVATRSLKSSYGGIKNYRFHSANEKTGITPDRWRAARDSLIGGGYLNKRGAITPKGRNAIAHLGTRDLSQFRVKEIEPQRKSAQLPAPSEDY